MIWRWATTSSASSPQVLCRESNKKTLGKEYFAKSKFKNSRQRSFFLPRANKKLLAKKKHLAKNFFTECFFSSRQRNLKKSFFTSNFFLSSTYTYTKLVLKFGTI
jgi:hypothetical protein